VRFLGKKPSKKKSGLAAELFKSQKQQGNSNDKYSYEQGMSPSEGYKISKGIQNLCSEKVTTPLNITY